MRLRLTRALAEMPGTIALNTLRPLTRDDDRAVAALASALAATLEFRPDHKGTLP
ncbi:hypothetical protein ACIHAX_35515 [Nocardia sp. NPDC051929]|uniref:hypothetical protein n=1 Tax=Nocardia sp. NPDC051929 TaxID=3364327 RepID=UPI0037C95E5D